MAEFEIIFVSIVFLSIGLLNMMKPELYIKFAKWQTKNIWKADFISTEHTKRRMRIFGFIFFLTGLIILFARLFFGFE